MNYQEELLVYLKKMKMETETFMETKIGSTISPAMNTLFYFMNIFMGIMVTALEQIIKQGGHRWLHG